MRTLKAAKVKRFSIDHSTVARIESTVS